MLYVHQNKCNSIHGLSFILRTEGTPTSTLYVPTNRTPIYWPRSLIKCQHQLSIIMSTQSGFFFLAFFVGYVITRYWVPILPARWHTGTEAILVTTLLRLYCSPRAAQSARKADWFPKSLPPMTLPQSSHDRDCWVTDRLCDTDYFLAEEYQSKVHETSPLRHRKYYFGI